MKHTMTRFASMILALIMLLSILVVPVSAATPFKDVSESAWYYEAVEYVTSRGWMSGVNAKTFAPNKDVDRALFVTVLARMAGVELDNSQVVFDDVPAGRYYTGAVAWAAENGIVEGIGHNKFAPTKNISRQELCTMILRFVTAMEYELEAGEPKTFTDENTVASWAKDGVAQMSAIGLVAGYEDGTFRPKATTTRAHVAQIIMRLDKILQGTPEDPVPMPAQSFNGEAGEDMTVSVEAPEGALPENTNMTVSRVTDEAKLASIAEKINGQVYAAADITFSKDNAELEPKTAVEVQISLDGLENLKNPTVYHMGADDTVEIVSSEMVSVNRAANDKALRFYASDFSVYIIGEGADTKLLTVEFQDQNGNVINTQVVNLKRMEKYLEQGRQLIHDPGVPTITATQSFEGWKTTSYSGEGVKTENVDVDDINTYITENYSANSQSGTLVYTAMVYEVRYVVYHDQAGAVLMTQAFHVQVNNGTVSTESVEIEHAYVGFMGGQNFAGWIEEKYVDVAGDYPLYKSTLNTAEAPSGNVYKNGATYNLNNTLQLYPYLNTGHWLVFDTYKDQDEDLTSTSYIGPVFYEEGANTVAPTVPTRTGYEFKGWYKEKAFTNRFIFGSPINEDTTIYAKWVPKATTYQVVFWQQNPTDAVDAADSAKTYSFYKSDERVATTGTSVQLNLSDSGVAADNRLGGNSTTDIGEMGFYFTYNGTKSDTGSEVVKGDGSTVLNVYYDRKVITYNFYGDLTSGYSSFNGNYYSSYYPHYGIVNNSYVRLNNSSSTYSDGDYWSPDGNWYYGSNTKYTGTVYHLTFDTETLSNNSADVQFGSIQGLYGSTMDSFDWSSASTTISGNDWPYSGNYLMWHDENTGRYLNKMFQYTTGEATTSTTINYYLNQYQVSSSTRPYTCLGQDTDGNFTITLDEASLKSTETLYFAGDEYFGYELSRYNKTTNNYNTATVWDGGEVSCSYSDIGSGGHAYFYYARNKWNFVYESNNSQVKTESVYWEKSLSSLSSYVPTNGPEGCYFDGWYADPAFDTPFDFTQEMPNHAVVVYAKWTVIRFRVVLDPTGGQTGVNASDITFPGKQATTFRVNYGELVEGSSINNAEREGYTLLGWYLDKEYTIPYNFGNPVTTATQKVDMDYINASDAERQGDDPWNDNLHYTDVGLENVRGKLTIYAQWRQNPDGVIGINVRYQAKDSNGNTGTFSDGAATWNDPNIYADQARAFGQPASTPDDSALQFLYWEILDKNGNVAKDAQGNEMHVYPGQLWTVDYKNAVEEAISAANSEAETYITAPEADAEPTRSSHPGEIAMPRTETVTVYAPADTVETGTDYLIGVKASNGTTYLLMSYNPSTGTYYGSASMSGYTTDHLSYAIPAVLDENGNVTGVDASGISGATLAHVEWIFNSTSNGKYSIQSGYNSSYYLRVGDDTINTTNLNLYPASYSSGYGATWVWDSSTHRLSHYYSSSYDRMYLSMLSVSGVPTYFDVDNDTDYARTVQLYKKTTIEVGPTMHTVTFMDGYTNTKIADVEVEDGGAATAPDAPDHSAQGMIFNGWDTAFDNVTEDITVTAQYVNQSTLSYTVTFRYMNAQGEWVSEAQTVQHGSSATAPTIPTPPTGYTFNSWDKKFDKITSNLTINAVYKKVATKKYVVTLRAVYGLKTTEAKTHIYWYANNGTEVNNGAGVRQENNGIEINAPVTIPTPSTFTYQVANRDGEATTVTGLKYEDHAFLGWARIDTATGADEKAHPELFTQDDCWLVWHEDASVNGGGYYTVNTAKDPDYIADGGTLGNPEANVAADEMTPYHDMYAVWAGYYYVFHSSTGKIEAIEVSKSKTTNEETQAVTVTTKTANLVDMVPEHYLYGGYYTYYGGAKDVLARADTETNSMRSFKNTAMANAFSVDHNSGTADKLVTVTGAEVYTAANLKTQNQNTGSVRFWTRANAYGYGNQEGANAGNELVPTVGTVYYLKEVPDAYLTNRIAYTIDNEEDSATKGEIIEIYMLTVVDDSLYEKIGYQLEDNSFLEYYTLSNTFTVSTKVNGEYQKLVIDAAKMNDELTRGYIAMNYATNPDSNFTIEDKKFTMEPKWKTLDGVEVKQNKVEYTIQNGKKEITWEGQTEPRTQLYVNLWHNHSDYGCPNVDWLDNNAITRAYFFSDTSTHAWAEFTAVNDKGDYVCDIPAGSDWNYVILVRCNPNVEFSEDDANWSFKWNQSADIRLPSNQNKNYIRLFYCQADGYQSTVTWKNYSEFYSN